jgi:antitoxin CptB
MDDRLKKLRFRAWRRGFREMDLVMGGFADAHIADLDPAGVDAFEALLAAPDQEVYDWILGRAPPPASHDTPTLALIRTFRFFARHSLPSSKPA